MAKNPHKLMSKVHFNTVFSKAWAKAALPSNAVDGFKKAGIHPLNEEAIPVYSQSSSTSNNSSASNYNNSITDSSTSSIAPSLTMLSPVMSQPGVPLTATTPLSTMPPAMMFPLVELATPTIIAAQ